MEKEEKKEKKKLLRGENFSHFADESSAYWASLAFSIENPARYISYKYSLNTIKVFLSTLIRARLPKVLCISADLMTSLILNNQVTILHDDS